MALKEEPARGALLLVDLDQIAGHEQGGQRPCIVISPRTVVAEQRYPILVIVPVTGTSGLSSLYPVVQPYRDGLTKPSAVLVDQIRAIDPMRVRRRYAPIPAPEMKAVDAALARMLDLYVTRSPP